MRAAHGGGCGSGSAPVRPGGRAGCGARRRRLTTARPPRPPRMRPLGPESREAYAARWDEVQSRFVDAPEVAVRHAQVLLDAVMAERGYPIGDELTARVDLVSVDHPELADHYRVAHRLHVESVGAGDGATEAQRQALLHYRALFAELLDAGRDGDGVGDEPVDPWSRRRRRRRAAVGTTDHGMTSRRRWRDPPEPARRRARTRGRAVRRRGSLGAAGMIPIARPARRGCGDGRCEDVEHERHRVRSFRTPARRASWRIPESTASPGPSPGRRRCRWRLSWRRRGAAARGGCPAERRRHASRQSMRLRQIGVPQTGERRMLRRAFSSSRRSSSPCLRARRRA